MRLCDASRLRRSSCSCLWRGYASESRRVRSSSASDLRRPVERGEHAQLGGGGRERGASPPRPDAPAIPRPSLRGRALRRHRRIRVLKLGVPLVGTHAPLRLAWQRYPRNDGFVEPWAGAGTLRPGLRFTWTYRGGGTCFFGSEAA